MSIGLSGTAGDISTMLFGSVSGGLSAELTGGNFWQGAATGLTVSALNHVAHKISFSIQRSKMENEFMKMFNGTKKLNDSPLGTMDEVNELIDGLPTLNQKYRIDLKNKNVNIRIFPNKNGYDSNGNILFGHTQGLDISIFKRAFNTYSDLISTLYHGPFMFITLFLIVEVGLEI